MKYVPSPISIQCRFVCSATANKSGRMQYHKTQPGISRIRISRTEFIRLYNESAILALRPIQLRGDEVAFQFEFFI